MKNYFLRCVSVLALFISCQSSLRAQKTVTPQMAIDVAKQLNSNSEYLYYYGKVPRVINDACGCHVTPTAFSSNPWLETQDSLWVVFIDQNPMSNWEHDCTFVFAMETATVHPLQAFADVITIEEHKEVERPKVVLTWAPHPKALPQAVPNSFAEWINATDYDFVIACPEGYELDEQFTRGAKITHDQDEALRGADFVYAKNWSCFRDPNYGKIISKDMNWTITAEKMALTRNAHFMHCLPVRRNMIVTDEVIEGERSLVIPEAANREISCQVVLKRILESLA